MPTADWAMCLTPRRRRRALHIAAGWAPLRQRGSTTAADGHAGTSRRRPLGCCRAGGESYLPGWLDERGIDRAVYVGHDLGAGVAQIAAVRQPDRCADLVVANGITHVSWPIPSVAALQKLGPALDLLPDPAVKAFLTGFYRRGHDDAAQASEALEVHWPPYARHGAAAALSRQIRSLRTRETLEVADRLPGLKVPARIVWGVADSLQKIEYGQRLAWDLDAPLTRIEGGKHWTPEDHPEEIAAALRDLLGEVA